MVQKVFIRDPFSVPYQTFLSNEQMWEVENKLRGGALCILPSDTCYALAGVASKRSVVEKISKLLSKENDPISLSFGDPEMVEEWVELPTAQRRIVQQEMPGAVTVVCDIRHDIDPGLQNRISKVLHTPRTIGVRISDSVVERLLAIRMRTPLTTCAIRDADGKEVRTYDEAYDIVRSKLEALTLDVDILGVKVSQIQYQNHSTVIGFAGENRILIYREGVLEPERIMRVIKRWGYYDVEDIP